MFPLSSCLEHTCEGWSAGIHIDNEVDIGLKGTRLAEGASHREDTVLATKLSTFILLVHETEMNFYLVVAYIIQDCSSQLSQ